jgi:hypothetical protein
MGFNTKAYGRASLSAGVRCVANGDNSIALGGVPPFAASQTVAQGRASLSIGSETKALKAYSIAIGDSTIADSVYAMAIGKNTIAGGFASLAMGYHTNAGGDYSTSLGNRTNAIGKYSLAVGHSSVTQGVAALAMGREAYANGHYSMAIGDHATADGNGAVALGLNSQATGNSSFSFGDDVFAKNDLAFAVGMKTTATGYGSRAMGPNLTVTGENSFGITLGPSVSTLEVGQNNTMAIMQGKVGIGTTTPSFKLDVAGDVNTEGDYLSGGAKTADYVFEEDYELESIEEHAEFMWKEKHLPAVKSQAEIDAQGSYSMSERREEILEEVEKAHIYIEQLNERIKELRKENQLKDEQIAVQKSRIDNLEQSNKKLKDKVSQIDELRKDFQELKSAIE